MLKPLAPPDALTWVASIYAPFALTWEAAKPLQKGVRVIGRAPGDAAVVDVSLSARRSVKAISLVCPIATDYVLLLNHTLALIHPRATIADADHWLAQRLTLLKQRPRVLATWGAWTVDMRVTQGLMAILMKPRW
jgi:hypothetical protein